jgi:hypothetical protein
MMNLPFSSAILLSVALAFSCRADAIDDMTKPTIVVNGKPDDFAACGISYKVPKLLWPNKKSDDVSGCSETYKKSDALEFAIQYTLDDPDLLPSEAQRDINFTVQRESLDKLIEDGSASFIKRGSDGSLVPRIEFSAICGSPLRHDVSEISGSNWRGWVVETVYPKLKSKPEIERCPEYSPDYRCVNLVIGNSKMSAAFNSKCFLRKRTVSLSKGITNSTVDTGLGYDNFMDIVKTIRFYESDAEENVH